MDSIIAAGKYTAALLNLAGKDSMKLTLVGTSGKNDNRYEAISGWSLDNFWKDQKIKNSPVNPFFDPAVQYFKFS